MQLLLQRKFVYIYTLGNIFFSWSNTIIFLLYPHTMNAPTQDYITFNNLDKIPEEFSPVQCLKIVASS